MLYSYRDAHTERTQCRILDGRRVAHVREDALRHHVETAKPTPSLAVLLVGHNPASEVYVRNKRMACARVGINFYLVRMNDSVRQEELIHEIHRLNEVSSRPMINITFFLVVFFFGVTVSGII